MHEEGIRYRLEAPPSSVEYEVRMSASSGSLLSRRESLETVNINAELPSLGCLFSLSDRVNARDV